jgi:hypothetical protein
MVEVPVDSVVVWTMQKIDFDTVAVYPIPCRKQKLTIEFIADSVYSNDLPDLEIELYAVDGYRIKTYRQKGITDGEAVQVVLDMTNEHNTPLSPGIYYAYIRYNDRVKRMKIPVIR